MGVDDWPRRRAGDRLRGSLLHPAADWGWRLVFIWGSLGLLFPFLSKRLEESPRWLENKGLLAEADATLDRIEGEVRRECGELPAPIEVSQPGPTNTGFRDLVARRNLPRTTVLVVSWIALTLGFYGFTAWFPTLLVARGFSLVKSLEWSSAISIGTIPGAFIAAMISDRWERKWLISVVSLVVAGCGLAYGLVSHPVAIVVLGFLMEMFLRTFSSLIYAYTPECFPTEIRNSGAGLSYGVGRLANIAGPLIIAFLYSRYGYATVFVYIAATWVIVASNHRSVWTGDEEPLAPIEAAPTVAATPGRRRSSSYPRAARGNVNVRHSLIFPSRR